MTYDQMQARVAAGARLLDEKKPGWYQQINLARLEMASCGQCILGQLFGHYDGGHRAVFPGMYSYVSQGPAVLYGFTLSSPNINLAEWDTLRVFWAGEIKARQIVHGTGFVVESVEPTEE